MTGFHQMFEVWLTEIKRQDNPYCGCGHGEDEHGRCFIVCPAHRDKFDAHMTALTVDPGES